WDQLSELADGWRRCDDRYEGNVGTSRLLAGRGTSGRLRRCGDEGRARDVVATARKPLPADESRPLPRFDPVGVWFCGICDRSVLLPTGWTGLPRSRFLRGAAESVRCAG